MLSLTDCIYLFGLATLSLPRRSAVSHKHPDRIHSSKLRYCSQNAANAMLHPAKDMEEPPSCTPRCHRQKPLVTTASSQGRVSIRKRGDEGRGAT